MQRAAARRRPCKATCTPTCWWWAPGLPVCRRRIELAQRGYQVVVLEADRVWPGRRGRNGGQAIAGFASGQEPFEQQLGEAEARRPGICRCSRWT